MPAGVFAIDMFGEPLDTAGELALPELDDAPLLLADEPALPDLLHPAAVAPTTRATSATPAVTEIRLFATQESYLS